MNTENKFPDEIYVIREDSDDEYPSYLGSQDLDALYRGNGVPVAVYKRVDTGTIDQTTRFKPQEQE